MVPMNLSKFDILILIAAHADRVKSAAKELNIIYDTASFKNLGLVIKPDKLSFDFLQESMEDLQYLFSAYRQEISSIVDPYVGENDEDWLGLDDLEDEEETAE